MTQQELSEKALQMRRQNAAGGSSLPDDETLINSGQLRERYGGCSHMWVERKLKLDPDFPRPIYISRRRYWRLAALRAYERLRALDSRPRAA